ncbi:MAG: lysophospholipid acyltransferase family protein [Cyanobacteriota bacterium]|nr:lysophospholipid acyltransferase family protein [Cyanobacteriota bacterium]
MVDRPGVDRDGGGAVVLTPAVLERVRQGVAIAGNPIVRRQIERDLTLLAAIAQGQPDPRVSGPVRHWLLRRLIKTFFRVRLENPQHIPHHATVLTANHLNHLDPFLLLAFVPPRPYYYILGDARTLYNQRWKRWVIGWAGGVIPLERWWKEEIAVVQAADQGRPDLKPLAEAIRQTVPNGSSIQQLRQIDQAIQAILARGDGILVFPEGRLGDREAQLHQPLKRGTVLYALRSGVPITPVAIVGTQDLFWRKRLTLRFGPALPVPRQPHPSRPQMNTLLIQLEQALTQLLPPTYREPKGPKLLRHWLNHLFW